MKSQRSGPLRVTRLEEDDTRSAMQKNMERRAELHDQLDKLLDKVSHGDCHGTAILEFKVVGGIIQSDSFTTIRERHRTKH